MQNFLAVLILLGIVLYIITKLWIVILIFVVLLIIITIAMTMDNKTPANKKEIKNSNAVQVSTLSPIREYKFVEFLKSQNIEYSIKYNCLNVKYKENTDYTLITKRILSEALSQLNNVSIYCTGDNIVITLDIITENHTKYYRDHIENHKFKVKISTKNISPNENKEEYSFCQILDVTNSTISIISNFYTNIRIKDNISHLTEKCNVNHYSISIELNSYKKFNEAIVLISNSENLRCFNFQINENQNDAICRGSARFSDYNLIQTYTYHDGIENQQSFKSDYQTAIYDFIKKYTECFFSTIHSQKMIAQYENIIPYCIENILGKKCIYMGNNESVEMQITKHLMDSEYFSSFEKKIDAKYSNYILAVNYTLPSIDNFPKVKQYRYIKSKNEISITKFSDSQVVKMYDAALYSICLRTIAEIFSYDKSDIVKSVVFNGYVTATNRSTGNIETKCIITIQVLKEKFLEINLLNVDPKQCFKSLKGVSASKLVDIAPVVPLLVLDKTDKRFVTSQSVKVDNSVNLASMQWEDFEHLIRELFEKEFSINGGEVKVTQASRDGGVDAIAFDPDPIRGGKIVIQAKRYTNTVGVSAVRDLYGTVMNEGANKGILVTTSDYGADSYDFAKDKPLTLLNGGHILHLLEKHGQKARIDIAEAKKMNTI